MHICSFFWEPRMLSTDQIFLKTICMKENLIAAVTLSDYRKYCVKSHRELTKCQPSLMMVQAGLILRLL